jgi:hypothetical protein
MTSGLSRVFTEHDPHLPERTYWGNPEPFEEQLKPYSARQL